MTLPPTTRTRLTHALVVRGPKGAPIGAAYSFAMQQSRETRDKFELTSYPLGLPNHVVPGNLTGRTLTIGVFDLYTRVAEEAFNIAGADIGTLIDQRIPFSLEELWRPPVPEIPGVTTGISLGNVTSLAQSTSSEVGQAAIRAGGAALRGLKGQSARRYLFIDCYVQSIGRTLSAESDRISRAEVTVVWTDRRIIE